jgi:hypothetical protein
MSTIPPSLERFRGELRRAVATDLERVPPHHRAHAGPPVPRRGLAVAGVLAALAAALTIGLPGGGPDVIGRAEAALSPAQPGVLHLRILVRTRTGQTLLRVDTWQLTVPPFSARGFAVSRSGTVREEGVSQRGRSIYDRQLQRVRRVPIDTAEPTELVLQDPVQEIRDLLSSGAARLTGRVRVAGREAYRFSLPEFTYLADARTLRPLELVGTMTDLDGRDHPASVARFLVYRLLPATRKNRALASVEQSHPGARVVNGVGG